MAKAHLERIQHSAVAAAAVTGYSHHHSGLLEHQLQGLKCYSQFEVHRRSTRVSLMTAYMYIVNGQFQLEMASHGARLNSEPGHENCISTFF